MPLSGTAIDTTQIAQDVDLVNAINALKSNDTQYQAFLQDQTNSVRNQIIQQKDATMNNVYGNLNRSAKVQEAVFFYKNRSQDLSTLQGEVYQKKKKAAEEIMREKDTTTRQHEMKEWTAENKRETLFVYSSMFITLMGLTLLTALYRMGLLSVWLWSLIGFPMILIFILLVIRVFFYTEILRSKRYWNKQRFDDNFNKTQVTLCDTLRTTTSSP